MTISTLLSLQHTSTTVLNGESSDASHLTDLAGFFQAALDQQIVAANLDADARAATVDQTPTGIAGNAILSSGEELPVTGTGLPAEQVTLARLSASLNAHIGSGKQDFANVLNALPLPDKAFERGVQLASQYFNNQTPTQNIGLDTTSTATPTIAAQRSIPSQYSESAATLAANPDVQAALKLAERNGVLFESSLKVPVNPTEQNRQQSASPVTSITANLLNDSSNDSKTLVKDTVQLTQNLPASGATITNTQTAAAVADVVRELGPFSFAGSAAVTNNSVQRVQVSQSGPGITASDVAQQGIHLDASLRSHSNDRVELAPGRSRWEGGLLAPSSGEQRVFSTGFSERSTFGGSPETLQLAPSNNLNTPDLSVGRQLNGELGSFDALREKFAEFNNNKALWTQHTANSAQQSAVKLNLSDQLVSDPMLMLNRQALNAESFRNTIKTALERGLGRAQDSTMRADHSPISETRPLDGDNGRTIALPSVSGPQSLNVPAATGASVFGGQMLDAAAGQAEAAAKLGQRIQWMLGSNARRADIQIDPPELGSVQIQVSQEDRQTTVSFVTQNASARELIEQSLPRLREHLENLGIELADANVEQQSNGQSERDDSKTDAVARSGVASNNANDEPADDNSRGDSNSREGGIDAYA